jgi:predicted nucleotide-binding protein
LAFQGKAEARDRLTSEVTKYVERRVKRVEKRANTRVVPPVGKKKKKKIFIVHGHDHVAREQLELVLHVLGLDPFVLAKSAGGGMTIIEALEHHIRPGLPEAAHFGIVLLTPDDVGHARKDSGRGSKARARQNVILELGMLVAALGRNKVAVLKTGDLELPSDISGVLYHEYRNHVREAVPALAKRLRDAGFELSGEAVASAAILD